MKSVELFAGGGGLGLGLSMVGFGPTLILEKDKWACDTIRENQICGYPLVQDWDVFECDVRNFDFDHIDGVELVSGGPPCQPFSLGGKHMAYLDERDMFPTTVDVVRKLRPRAFLIENVKGITRHAFANYFQYILLQLSFPEIIKKNSEPWMDHLSRLEKHKIRGRIQGLAYNVVARLLNAADYGVPQLRERIFIVGFRTDQDREWSFPEPTHSMDTLLYDQWISGEYWERHEISLKNRPSPPAKILPRIKKLNQTLFPNMIGKPWRTVRDALSGLPDPRDSRADKFHNHTYQPGAKSYPGHTGSQLDFPAKTLKAGDHGVPGGENMLVMPNGGIRYFSVRESARLQTFPDGYRFHGSWTETMRQLGNAVPVILARAVGASIVQELVLSQEKALLKQSNEIIS